MYKDSGIQGWMHLNELQFLYDEMSKIKDSSVVVEVGSWKGRSSHAMASGLKDKNIQAKLFCVDTFKGAVTNPTQLKRAVEDKPLEEFKKNMEQFDAEIIVGESVPSASVFEDKSIDFLFLDANHDYEFVCDDLSAWMPKIKDGGIICGHDYKEGYKGVKRAVDERFVKIKTYPDSIWYFENGLEKECRNDTLDYFNSEAEYHHQKFHVEDPNNQRALEELVTPLVNEISRPLLEVGCGPGDSGLIVKPDVAMDFSEEMVKQASKLLPDTEFKVGNAEDIPFPNDSFSTIITVACLQHTLHPAKAIKEMIRVARDKVIIVTNNFDEYHNKTEPFMVHYFSEEFLKNMLKGLTYSYERKGRSSIIMIRV